MLGTCYFKLSTNLKNEQPNSESWCIPQNPTLWLADKKEASPVLLISLPLGTVQPHL